MNRKIYPFARTPPTPAVRTNGAGPLDPHPGGQRQSLLMAILLDVAVVLFAVILCAVAWRVLAP